MSRRGPAGARTSTSGSRTARWSRSCSTTSGCGPEPEPRDHRWEIRMPGHVSEPVGPVDGRKVPRYAGHGSFGRLPEIDRAPDYDVAVLGVPFDNGTSYRPGARFGPMAVRQASRHLRPGHHVELDTSPFAAIQVVDAGDAVLDR